MLRFEPGDGTAIAGSWFFALVDSPASDEFAQALADGVDRGEGSVDDLIELLFGSPLDSLPGFGVACVSDDEIRVFVRGSVRAEVDETFGPQLLDASERRTWLEQRVDRDAGVSFGLAGRPPVGELHHRIGVGVVSASRIVWPSGRPVGPPVVSVPPVTAVMIEPPVDELVDEPAAEPVAFLDAPDPEGGPRASSEAEAEPGADLLDPPVMDDSVSIELPPDAGAVTSLYGSDETIVGFPDSHDLDALGRDVDDPPVDQTVLVLDGIETDVPAIPSDLVDPYDHLFGATRNASVEAAAVRAQDAMLDIDAESSEGFIDSGPTPSPASATGDPSADDWDHDGNTQSLQSLRGHIPVPGTTVVSGAGLVAAVVCQRAHANPPYSTLCRICGDVIVDTDPEMVPRPAVGVLVFPNGDRLAVDRAVIVGRKPEAQGVFEGLPPRFVALADEQEVSRTHLEFRVDGWNATVMDYGSTFGTILRLPGRDPEAIRAGVPMTILPGSELLLADCVTIRFEVQ